ncbi:ligand-binding sensor domain-containing protein [Taibaiella koreensis]|uniref:hypothetical protein n=1 Tax=Taibaiella koreensis TaxID=1268548 RepID=UPI0013C2AD2D|nr:hypothetical protein [Taibaiella koreensis]
MRRLSYFLVLLPALCLPRAKVWSREKNYIHYRWEQGFTAINGYALCHDWNGYIWIGTENGVMRFNGYDFRLYTSRDGLPDNEVFGFIENNDGRLWLLPFANTLAYIRTDVIYNEATDTSLRKYKLASCPLFIYFDAEGTSWIYEQGILTRHTAKGQVQKIRSIDGIPLANKWVKYWLGPGQELMALVDDRIYRWGNKAFHQVSTLPFEVKGYTYADSSLICDFQSGKQIQYRDTAGSLVMDIKNTSVLKSAGTLRIVRLSREELGIGTDAGFYIYNTGSLHITDSFLTGCRVNAILSARDGAIWLGTTGKGIYRFMTTPVKSVKGIPEQAPILYIRGTDKGMYGTTDRSELIQAVWSSRGLMEKLRNDIINPNPSYRQYVFIARNRRGQWLSFGQNTKCDLRRHPQRTDGLLQRQATRPGAG